jgi:hypothetical protein
MVKRLVVAAALHPPLVAEAEVAVIQSKSAYLHQVALLFRLGRPGPVQLHL